MRAFLATTALASALLAPAASAQLSVTTIGATNAQACYEDARGMTSDAARCDEALEEDALSPKDRQATLVNRGIIHNRAGRYEKALADFDAALDRDPALAEAWLNRGNTLLLTGRADAAIENYQAALDNGIGAAAIAWYNIGLAYEAKDDAAKAREAFTKALEIDPAFALARDKLAGAG